MGGAYREHTHSVERLNLDASTSGGHGAHHEEPAPAEHEHEQLPVSFSCKSASSIYVNGGAGDCGKM